MEMEVGDLMALISKVQRITYAKKNLKSFALTDARQNDIKINKFAISIITSSVAVPDILSASSISSLDNPMKKN